MTTVVLGWDGLDADLVRRFGMAESFGADGGHRIETLTNPALKKPHTYELWPTIITGLTPAEHGIHAETYVEGGEWSNPAIDALARLSQFTVPESLRWRVGRWVRAQGATFDFESEAYYRDRDIPTVFDGCRAFPLAIPNYRSPVDDQLDIESDRGAHLAELMDIRTAGDGRTVHEPSVGLEVFHHRIAAELARKIGAVTSALQWDYDLVFVWLGYLDTAGHVAPTVSDHDGWVRDAYETAAEVTQYIRSTVPDGDTVFCLSDHGLQAGAHTDHAYIGSWPPQAAADVASVVDIADAIEATVAAESAQQPRHSTSETPDDFQAVEARLEELGYL